jgi:tetratricopeptide (TPR) repeat protein
VIAHEIGNKKNEGVWLTNLRLASDGIGNASKDVDRSEKAQGIYSNMKCCQGNGESLFKISQTLDKLGYRSQAIDCAQKALQIFEQIESPKVEKVRLQLAEWQASGPQEK